MTDDEYTDLVARRSAALAEFIETNAQLLTITTDEFDDEVHGVEGPTMISAAILILEVADAGGHHYECGVTFPHHLSGNMVIGLCESHKVRMLE